MSAREWDEAGRVLRERDPALFEALLAYAIERARVAVENAPPAALADPHVIDFMDALKRRRTS